MKNQSKLTKITQVNLILKFFVHGFKMKFVIYRKKVTTTRKYRRRSDGSHIYRGHRG